MREDEKLTTYLRYIEKAVSKNVWIKDVREDIEQEVFIKLFKKGFFEQHELEDGLITTYAQRYIFRTVNSCFSDYVIKKDFIKEPLVGNGKSAIKANYIEKNANSSLSTELDDEEDIFSIPASVSLEAKEALGVIRRCFEIFAEMNKDPDKLAFFDVAFWRRIYLDISIKDLAEQLGFVNSNPTQEFNRFVAKVSTCTEKDGIKVTNPSEQVEILLELISA